MSYYLALPLLLLVAVGQSTLFAHTPMTGASVDLMLAVVLSWGLLNGNPEALAWGFIGGLFLDLLSGLPVGVGILPLVAVAALAGTVAGGLHGQHPLVPLASSLVATPLYYALYFLLLVLVQRPIPVWTFVATYGWPLLLGNTVTVLVVFPVIRWIYRLTNPPKIEL